jgi:hypothetical protein
VGKAARAGKRRLIVDADLGLANVDIIFGVKPMHHIGDLLQPGVSAMYRFRRRHRGQCAVLRGHGPGSGAGYREIAGILKVSEPRVCQLHTEAIGQLRKLLPDA